MSDDAYRAALEQAKTDLDALAPAADASRKLRAVIYQLARLLNEYDDLDDKYKAPHDQQGVGYRPMPRRQPHATRPPDLDAKKSAAS